jgi:glycosyltransferase involved in cell wall biosynthesis
VSVLIPSYNHEKFVSACLDSVARETYPDIEILLIDDGSRDRTYDVACAWRDLHAGRFARIDMQRQDNAGLTRTLNRLIEKSRGQYIALLASDDMLAEGGIAARVEALHSHPQW